jgi:uncharacterized protein (TIGR02594 family)
MKPVWLDIAEGELGTVEKRGGENPRIIEYHDTCTLHAKEDEIAWCSSFVNWCMKKAGVKGTNSAAAKDWLDWGTPLSAPQVGCVCVIKQKGKKKSDQSTGTTSGYHVGLWMKTENGRVFLLGGNQGDQVKISSFGLGSYEICGYRWPTT